MSKIKLILEGLHDNHYLDDGSYLIDPLTSSVTLIKIDKKNILIDTGTPHFLPEILKNLAEENLRPEQIDYLILTHNHLDHTFNAYIFPNALIYTQKSFWHWQETKCQIYPNGVPEDAISGVSLMQTPGHTVDSLSVLVEDDRKKRWAIVGDAMNIHYLENGSLAQRIGKDGLKSIQKILDFKPDFIVPGHGKILQQPEIQKFKEMF